MPRKDRTEKSLVRKSEISRLNTLSRPAFCQGGLGGCVSSPLNRRVKFQINNLKRTT